MINTKTFGLEVDPDAYFNKLGGKRNPVDQDAEVTLIAMVGNLVMSSAFVHARIFDQ